MKSRISKIITFSALIVLIIAVIVSIGFAFALVYLYNGINFDADEMLFEHSCEFASTAFYADVYETEEPRKIESAGSLRKIHYSLDEISSYVKDGFVAVEDGSFFEHNGINLRRTVMAAVNYIAGSDRSFGASTITQQVVKNISGDNQHSIKRKLAEIVRALHIEKHYTKDEILEVYLNVIPMSENIYGIGAAAKAYFGKEPSELSCAEAATLIGITNAPSAYNPYNNTSACIKKRNIILGVMRRDGIIDDDEYNEAINTPISLVPREEREDRFDSWFVETVIADLRRDIAQKYGITESAAEIMLLGGGYKVYTTMNLLVQNALEDYFYNESNFPREISDGLNYAMAITDSSSGRLVGIVGRVGEKKGNRLLNHALAPHTPGSVLKPIALYAPLIDDKRINWASVFDDVPVSFSGEVENYKAYPRNSPDVYDGLISIKDAIRLSKNTVAVRLCNMLGVKKVFSILRDNYKLDTLVENDGGLTDLGISPMALGQLTKGVSLKNIVEAYSVFPSDGVRREAITYTRVVDYRGDTILTNEGSESRTMAESTARIMNQMLMSVTESGTAKGLKLKNKVQLAGKTGTSGGNKDKLFIGYTPYYIAGIWCGYDNGNKEVVGLSRSHLEIWDDIMCLIHEQAMREEKNRTFSTEGLIYMPYCRDSGRLFTEVCAFDPRGNRRDFGYFTEDNMPSSGCSRHIMCAYDSVTKAVACKHCPAENIIGVALVSIPDRSFPQEIYVTDAEYVYRDVSGYIKRPIDYSLPYFFYAIPDDTYVGKSRSKKQFNSNCYIHDE